MPRILDITSVQNPRIKAVLRMRKSRVRRDAEAFIAEGHREITRAASAGLRCIELYIVEGQWSGRMLDELYQAAGDADRFHVTPQVIDKIAYLKEDTEGALAIFESPQWSVEQVLAQPVEQSEQSSPLPARRPLWLVAEGIEKPGNLGAMARSADAAGAAGMLVADGVVDALNPNAIRASTGAVFSLPIAGGSSQSIRERLIACGVMIVAASPDPAHAQQYTAIDYGQPTAIVVGAEDRGLSDVWTTVDLPHHRLASIPMLGRSADSLNASVASAVLLFEASRQWDAKKYRT